MSFLAPFGDFFSLIREIYYLLPVPVLMLFSFIFGITVIFYIFRLCLR